MPRGRASRGRKDVKPVSPITPSHAAALGLDPEFATADDPPVTFTPRQLAEMSLDDLNELDRTRPGLLDAALLVTSEADHAAEQRQKGLARKAAQEAARLDSQTDESAIRA